MGSRDVIAFVALLLVSACSFAWDDLDPRVAGSGGSGATAAVGGGGNGGVGGTATGTGGSSTSTGGGGTGGAGDWLAPGFDRRRVLTVSNDTGEGLSDFPLLVRLDANRIDYAATQAAGEDLRFFDEAGTPLDHEIEHWEDGSSIVWVRVPTLSGGDPTRLSMYYANPAAADGQSPPGVWVGYAAVWHLGASLDDSTTNHDGTNGGSIEAAGTLGRARSFDGVDDYVEVSQPGGLDGLFSGGATVSVWVNASGYGGNGFGRIVDRSTGGTGETGWILHVNQAATTFGIRRDFTTTGGNWSGPSSAVTLGSWQQVTMVYDDGPGAPALFVDGVEVPMSTTTAPVGTATPEAGTPIRIGNRAGAIDRAFDGLIDELRVSTSARSEAWIVAQHQSMTDAMVAYGPEELEP